MDERTGSLKKQKVERGKGNKKSRLRALGNERVGRD